MRSLDEVIRNAINAPSPPDADQLHEDILDALDAMSVPEDAQLAISRPVEELLQLFCEHKARVEGHITDQPRVVGRVTRVLADESDHRLRVWVDGHSLSSHEATDIRAGDEIEYVIGDGGAMILANRGVDYSGCVPAKFRAVAGGAGEGQVLVEVVLTGDPTSENLVIALCSADLADMLTEVSPGDAIWITHSEPRIAFAAPDQRLDYIADGQGDCALMLERDANNETRS